MNKILLILQYYEGDKQMAMRLADFIADLQPGRCEIADFLFARRFDCKQSDTSVIEKVSRKFNVHTFQCRRRGVGWPTGPNELWFGTMEHVYHMIGKKVFRPYKAVLTFEADCVPLSRNWLSHFDQEWDKASAKQPGLCAMGDIVSAPGEHINGNAMFSADRNFLHFIAKRVISCRPHGGWDYYLAPVFKKRGWARMPGLISEWGTKTFPEERFADLIKQGVVFFHGVKDESLLNMSRKFLL